MDAAEKRQLLDPAYRRAEADRAGRWCRRLAWMLLVPVVILMVGYPLHWVVVVRADAARAVVWERAVEVEWTRIERGTGEYEYDGKIYRFLISIGSQSGALRRADAQIGQVRTFHIDPDNPDHRLWSRGSSSSSILLVWPVLCGAAFILILGIWYSHYQTMLRHRHKADQLTAQATG